MIAIDTNILVYAHREDSPWHADAYAVVEALAEGTAPWGIPAPCIHEFLSIVTHPRIYQPSTSIERALEQVDAWLASPSAVILSEQVGYWTVLRDVVADARSYGAQVHDARIAALCLHHGVHELLTADRDFGRFETLAVRNPLIQRRSGT